MSGIPLTDAAKLHRALLAAGLAVGQIGGDELRTQIAHRLATSGLLARIRAEAWDEGWAARSDSLAEHRAATTANPYRDGATS